MLHCDLVLSGRRPRPEGAIMHEEERRIHHQEAEGWDDRLERAESGANSDNWLPHRHEAWKKPGELTPFSLNTSGYLEVGSASSPLIVGPMIPPAPQHLHAHRVRATSRGGWGANRAMEPKARASLVSSVMRPMYVLTTCRARSRGAEETS
eukprot:759665-Hanusia_phi.AAC.1